LNRQTRFSGVVESIILEDVKFIFGFNPFLGTMSELKLKVRTMGFLDLDLELLQLSTDLINFLPRAEDSLLFLLVLQQSAPI
jgi:hypothetical protein